MRGKLAIDYEPRPPGQEETFEGVLVARVYKFRLFARLPTGLPRGARNAITCRIGLFSHRACNRLKHRFCRGQSPPVVRPDRTHANSWHACDSAGQNAGLHTGFDVAQ